MAFESKVIKQGLDTGIDENHIYSMGPGEQKVFGYYPMGRSDRRYLAVTIDGWQALLFQRVKGKHARRIWRLTLTKAAGKPKFTGTLAKILLRHGVMVTGVIPGSARHDLNKSFGLAAYGFDGIGNLSAWTINQDGSLGPIYDNIELPKGTFPIVPEETMALRLGKISWPSNLKQRSSPSASGK